MKTIITVEDIFLIKNRGVVVTGWQENNSASVKIGDKVEIIRPDKTIINSQVIGIENFIHQKCFGETDRRNIAFLLSNVTKTDIPRGSIINLLS
jgi:translation elongation factor EF-Tu-like GTPase